jgi:pimeloyl-ACP methyl ester carboxylesterase
MADMLHITGIRKVLLATCFFTLTMVIHAQETMMTTEEVPKIHGIETLEPVTLGGLQQWILIRGDDTSNPVLLWLHGGPGSPTLPLAHQYDGELLEYFTVVHWDQRGAGKSFDAELSPDTMKIENFVSDTVELANLLRARFRQEKIYLVGHSWGSVLGALTAARTPELFHAFVGAGQAVNIPEAQVVAYEQLLEQARASTNQQALDELTTIGTPPWSDQQANITYATWVNHFGGVMRGVTGQDLDKTVASSPYYTAEDREKWQQGQGFSAQAMIAELMQVNLIDEVKTLEVPVYIFSGKHDLNSPGSLAQRWLDGLEAPSKELVIFENSAHFLMWEENEQFNQEMLRVREETPEQ